MESELTAKLQKLRRHHLEVEDRYYSCPASPDYAGPESNVECECGSDRYNALLDECIALSKEKKRLMDVDQPHVIDMPDGSRFIITLEERAATGSSHVKVIYDNNRTKGTMFVKASSDNVITLHSIKEP